MRLRATVRLAKLVALCELCLEDMNPRYLSSVQDELQSTRIELVVVVALDLATVTFGKFSYHNYPLQ